MGRFRGLRGDDDESAEISMMWVVGTKLEPTLTSLATCLIQLYVGCSVPQIVILTSDNQGSSFTL